jgi:hypothetical protein
MLATAEALHNPVDYIDAVLDARPRGTYDIEPGALR